MAPEVKNLEQYESLTADPPKSLVAASTGGDGSGKSDFWLSAPDPIFVCAFDPYGMNRVRKEAKLRPDGSLKDIRVARYPFNAHQFGGNRQACQKAAIEIWQQFRADYDLALQKCRTVVWDREDMMYELQRFANFGQQNDAPKEYGPLYLEYGWLVQKATAFNCNLGILRGLRDKWVSKFDPQKQKMVAHNTGEKMPDGMNKTADLVDITLTHRWDSVARAYMVKIDKFTNAAEKDKEYADLRFTDMALAAYPDSFPEDWQ